MYVNGHCVLGFTHQDVVAVFQQIPVKELLELIVCRGYRLPFDPDDPNTEIVTTVAVTSSPQQMSVTPTPSYRLPPTPTSGVPGATCIKNNFSDLQVHNNLSPGASARADQPQVGAVSPAVLPEFITVQLKKGGSGFGFTITESPHGQRVKKISDKARCKELQEGDLLLEVNGMDVRSMTHAELVDHLKHCIQHRQTVVTVQRGGQYY